jgi:hypothetical protein
MWLIAAFVASAGLISFSFGYPVSDDAFFEVVGREMVRGTQLYSGIWDNKPPGVYLTNAVLQLVFGDRYLLHRIAQYLVTLASIGVFAVIARRSFPAWGAATFTYAILISTPTMAFLNYSQQYATLPINVAVLFAMQARPVAAGLAQVVAVVFWPPTLLTAMPIVLWLGDRRRAIVYLIALLGGTAITIGLAMAAYSPNIIANLWHDMSSYQSLRSHADGPLLTEIRWRLTDSLLQTAFAFPLLALVALFRLPAKRDEAGALLWFATALAGALTNLNFSEHYFYPAVAPTIYALFLFAGRTVWNRGRIVASIAVGTLMLALLPRTLNDTRRLIEARTSAATQGKLLGAAVATYVQPGDTF